MNLGESIRHYRQMRGFSQESLAEILDVTQGTVGHWENGRREPSISQTKLIAKALGVTLITLLADEGLREDERHLLDDYRNSCTQQQEVLRQTASFLAQKDPEAKTG